MPGGISSPVVWGDRLFLTGYENSPAADAGFRSSGWPRTLAPRRAGGKDRAVPFVQFSSRTHALHRWRTVYVYFGSYGLIAYDFSGGNSGTGPLNHYHHNMARIPPHPGRRAVDPATRWRQHEFPTRRTRAGHRKDPVRNHRDHSRSCYSTPMVWRHEGVEELIVQGKGRVTAYRMKGGNQLVGPRLGILPR